ncbi:hypothetical protein [Kistimonas asteriae]|uniref:hypothetical protein n=1 Tax=Kistimonas asteriae TaxID=517724 RepID=UPI001BA5A7AC|nr:hypothetical protein [Kistimonas asteriae]
MEKKKNVPSCDAVKQKKLGGDHVVFNQRNSDCIPKKMWGGSGLVQRKIKTNPEGRELNSFEDVAEIIQYNPKRLSDELDDNNQKQLLKDLIDDEVIYELDLENAQQSLASLLIDPRSKDITGGKGKKIWIGVLLHDSPKLKEIKATADLLKLDAHWVVKITNAPAAYNTKEDALDQRAVPRILRRLNSRWDNLDLLILEANLGRSDKEENVYETSAKHIDALNPKHVVTVSGTSAIGAGNIANWRGHNKYLQVFNGLSNKE